MFTPLPSATAAELVQLLTFLLNWKVTLYCGFMFMLCSCYVHVIFLYVYSCMAFFHARAVDADQGNNAAIRYAIIGGNTQGQFSIDSMSGEVSLVKPLDYETLRSYRLVIRAQGKLVTSCNNIWY